MGEGKREEFGVGVGPGREKGLKTVTKLASPTQSS